MKAIALCADNSGSKTLRLTSISVRNFRSIKAAEKNSHAALKPSSAKTTAASQTYCEPLNAFLSSGAGGVEPSDFNDQSQPASIECEFTGLSVAERSCGRTYSWRSRGVAQELRFSWTARGRSTVKAEYGYQAEPKEFHLSLRKSEESQPDWAKLAEGAFSYAADDGKVNKTS